MEWLCIGIILLTAILATIAVWLARLAEIARKNQEAIAQAETNQILNYISAARLRLSTQFSSWFLVQPCFRCLEFKMKFLAISPNARSIEYQCEHCKKTMRAAASSPESGQVSDTWALLHQAIEEYDQRPSSSKPFGQGDKIRAAISFDAPPAPMPYEQTSRTPIPEAVRSEVWRRDGGKCVQCQSVQNLQFDHIIPVSRGGATTVANLQLLCLSCNASKGGRI